MSSDKDKKGNYSLKLWPGQCCSSVWADAADLQVSILPRPWCSDNQGWCKWEPIANEGQAATFSCHLSAFKPGSALWFKLVSRVVLNLSDYCRRSFTVLSPQPRDLKGLLSPDVCHNIYLVRGRWLGTGCYESVSSAPPWTRPRPPSPGCWCSSHGPTFSSRAGSPSSLALRGPQRPWPRPADTASGDSLRHSPSSSWCSS